MLMITKKLLVSVDLSNLYYCVQKRWNGRLDYVKYLEHCQTYGDIYRAIAYGAQLDGEANSFISLLKQAGYEPRYKTPRIYDAGEGREFRKADWDVGMSIDVVRILDNVDGIILGSADSDMIPLVEYVQSKGKVVIVVACNIAYDLKAIADQWWEIGTDLLIGASNESPKSMVVFADSSSLNPASVSG